MKSTFKRQMKKAETKENLFEGDEIDYNEKRIEKLFTYLRRNKESQSRNYRFESIKL